MLETACNWEAKPQIASKRGAKTTFLGRRAGRYHTMKGERGPREREPGTYMPHIDSFFKGKFDRPRYMGP